MKEGDRYPWLDPFRAGLDEVIAFILSPDCVCEWRGRTSEVGFDWVLDVRNRDCPMHGEAGLF